MPTVVDQPHCEACGQAVNGAPLLVADFVPVRRRFELFRSLRFCQVEDGRERWTGRYVCGLECGRTVCTAGQYLIQTDSLEDIVPTAIWDHTGQPLTLENFAA